MGGSDLKEIIVERNQGVQKSHFLRMLSPSFGGNLIKPFVLLDYFEPKGKASSGFLPHFHSGIATLSYMLAGSLEFSDSLGASGRIAAGSIEWMSSGGGVWHQGKQEGETIQGIQLWLALPPELEDGEARSQYIEKEQVPVVGNTRVLLGELAGKKSPICSNLPIHFYQVELRRREAWEYQVSPGYSVNWLFIYQGSVMIQGERIENELVIFNPEMAQITLLADYGAKFFFGSAKKHEYPLLTAIDMIHTNSKSMQKGQERKEKELHQNRSF